MSDRFQGIFKIKFAGVGHIFVLGGPIRFLLGYWDADLVSLQYFLYFHDELPWSIVRDHRGDHALNFGFSPADSLYSLLSTQQLGLCVNDAVVSSSLVCSWGWSVKPSSPSCSLSWSHLLPPSSPPTLDALPQSTYPYRCILPPGGGCPSLVATSQCLSVGPLQPLP